MNLIVFTLLFLVSRDASAYLDPGTGSMLLQVILGGVAAVAVAVKLYWFRILAVLGIRKEPPQEKAGG
jgi:hypothetical protein